VIVCDVGERERERERVSERENRETCYVFGRGIEENEW